MGGWLGPKPNVGKRGAGVCRAVPLPGRQGQRGRHRTLSTAPGGNRYGGPTARSSASTSSARSANSPCTRLRGPDRLTAQRAPRAPRRQSLGGASPAPFSTPPPGASEAAAPRAHAPAGVRRAGRGSPQPTDPAGHARRRGLQLRGRAGWERAAPHRSRGGTQEKLSLRPAEDKSSRQSVSRVSFP